MGESRNAYRVLVGRPEGKRPLERPRRRWEDNIKMDLREAGYDGRDWINLAQDRDRWRAYVRAAMNLRVKMACDGEPSEDGLGLSTNVLVVLDLDVPLERTAMLILGHYIRVVSGSDVPGTTSREQRKQTTVISLYRNNCLRVIKKQPDNVWYCELTGHVNNIAVYACDDGSMPVAVDKLDWTASSMQCKDQQYRSGIDRYGSHVLPPIITRCLGFSSNMRWFLKILSLVHTRIPDQDLHMGNVPIFTRCNSYVLNDDSSLAHLEFTITLSPLRKCVHGTSHEELRNGSSITTINMSEKI
ncbi:hypothetical protein ANN_09891 [Periplaneta americana]|uniref:Uncharacterized protein n=1 Tax=Periplaneta americana TaxID=6978 RepID=A0ABQ8TMW8_PERAM|nr:hypothetical protein ANN_09891 [Periplaneta americana]